jgi:hypothetical protein
VSALRRSLLIAAPLTAVCVVVGVVLAQPSQTDRTEPPASTATPPAGLADVDTTALEVRRQAFCDRVPTAAVRAALGGPSVRATSYGDGDTAELAPNVRDVAGEYACTWHGRGGATADAWVFATAVTRARARTLVATPAGCEKEHEPAYGRPTVALSCADRGRTTVSLRGLFGDAWLSCSLTGRGRQQASSVTARAEQWCLAVARSAD